MLQYRYPLLRLPVRVDVDRLRYEADQFPSHVWCPDRFAGAAPASYTMLALVSHRGRENNEMFGPFAPTPVLSACPYIRQLLAFFDAPVCEVRLRWLGPRASGHFHFDRHRLLEDRYRVHVPIYTTPHAYFHCGDRVVHMPAGSVWTFDRMRRHAVFNDDLTTGRLHLIMDFGPSDKIQALVRCGMVDTRPAEADTAIGFDPSRDPKLEFELECPPAVWSSDRLRSEIEELRKRFTDDSRFFAMVSHTDLLIERWGELWQRHRDARAAWPEYQKLARTYYAAWRDLRPSGGVADEVSETSWIACLLDTGAFVPSRAPVAPSWSANETYRLLDTVRITIGVDGAAKVSTDGACWQPAPVSGLRAMLEVARGAGVKELRAALGRRGLDEAWPTLRWVAEQGALRVSDDGHQLWLFGRPERAPSDVEFVVSPATLARLKRLGARLRGARFRCTGEVNFLVRPSGEAGAYLPHVKGFDLVFPDALAIAQYMALGFSVEQIARATRYACSDDFLTFVAWLWDVLPFECDGDAALRKPTFVQRLEAGEAITLPSLALPDPIPAITEFSATGSYAIVLDTTAHAPASVRIAAATARIKHVDLLVKTSQRTGIAKLADLPLAGFVVSDCDTTVLGEVEAALGPCGSVRPFVLAVVETMQGLAEIEDIARSAWVDALVVGAGDLAKNARLAGVDPEKTIARAQAQVHRFARREGKLWAVVAGSAAEAARARRRGAALVLRTDQAIFAEGIRSVMRSGSRGWRSHVT